jgi:hypothetical protein
MKLRLLPVVVFAFVLTVDPSHTYAQSSRFNAGLIVGMNLSELEGNGVTDYLGLNAGLIGTARLTPRTQIGLELLFSQNGEYVLPKFYPQIPYGQIWLNHLEVPLHYDWLLLPDESKHYFKCNLNMGVAYARLMHYTVKSLENEVVNNQIVYENLQTMLWQAGLTYNFSKNIGVNLKATLPIRRTELSWTLAARLIFLLNS